MVHTVQLGASPEPLAAVVDRGGVLAIPTESSYGLAADPWSARGVEAIYRIKGREAGKPLPVVIADRAAVADLGIDPNLPILARLAPFWPAPLTVVLPLGALAPGQAPPPATAGERTLAVRVPAHAGLRRLLVELGRPLTATSANVSGSPPVLDPHEAARLLGGEDAVVIDGGRLPGGPPSTLVVPSPGGLRVLRRGAFPAERLGALLESPGGPGPLGGEGAVPPGEGGGHGRAH